MYRISIFLLCLITACLIGPVANKASASDDEAGVRKAIASYVDAFNQGDAAAVTAHWSELGEWIDPTGTPIQGRDAILTEMKAYFSSDTKPKIELLDLSVRFLAQSVAVEQGTALVTRPDDSASESPYFAIHVLEDGKWQLSSVRELAANVRF